MNKEKVKMLLASAERSQSDIARELGCTPQNLGKKINSGKLKPQELQRIAELCGAEYRESFRLKDGTEI